MTSDTSAIAALFFYSDAVLHRLRSSLALFQTELMLFERETGKDLSTLKARFAGMKELLAAATIPSDPGALRTFALKQISDLIVEFAPVGTSALDLVVRSDNNQIEINGPVPVESGAGLSSDSFTDLFCKQLGRESFRPPMIDSALQALGLSAELSITDTFSAVIRERSS